MAERFVFTVDYDEATLKLSFRRFAFRFLFLERMSRPLSLGLLIAYFGVVVVWRPEPRFFSGLCAGAAAGVLLLTGLGWWQRWHATKANLLHRQATFRLGVEDFSSEVNGEASRLKWSSVEDIWRYDRFWLLALVSKRFVTLPLESVPQDALAFLASKVIPKTVTKA